MTGKRGRQPIWLAVGLFSFLALGALAGCGAARHGGTVSVKAPDFFGLGENLARQLLLNHRHDGSGEKVIMTTFVNLDQLEQTSSFGRLLTEALATQLFHHGMDVVETRKAAEILLENGRGELVLSRELKRVGRSHAASAIIAGTYSLTPQTVVINVRLLDAGSDAVLSVAGMELQRSHAINALLSESGGIVDGQLSAYERLGG